jgi:hypothetical protein
MTNTRKTELDFKEATLKYRCKKTGLIEVRSANLQEWFEDEEYDLIGFETEDINNLRHTLENLVSGLYDADKEFKMLIELMQKDINERCPYMTKEMTEKYHEVILADFVRDVKKNLDYQRWIITTHLLDKKGFLRHYTNT